MTNIALIAKGLTPRPSLALVNWPRAAELDWTQVVAFAAIPIDRRAMAYKSVLLPLEKRGLAEIAFPGSYDPETGLFEYKRYRLTALGLSVKSYLERNPND